MLDNKSGNSNSQDRIDVLEKCFAVVDVKRIGLVIGDREFVGHKWIKYLKDNSLNFVMRFPKHHLITLESGDVLSISELELGLGESCCFETCQVDGCWGKVWVKRLDEQEYLYLFGTAEVTLFGQLYRKRSVPPVRVYRSLFSEPQGPGFPLGIDPSSVYKQAE